MVDSRCVRLAGIVLPCIGIAMLVVAALQGNLDFAILVVFPVIVGQGILPALGGLMLFVGLVLLFLSFLIGFEGWSGVPPDASDTMDGGERGRWGGVILIGPIPIVFGSDRRMALLTAIVAMVILIILAILFLI